MAAVGHFGCPKFTFDHISGHFRSIRNFFLFCYFLRRTFWMFENHFRSHFWPFLIDRPFWMSEIYFRSHFWPFQIHTDLNYFLKFLTKWLPSAILDVRNSLSITFLPILDQYGFIFYFLQNGRRRTFWMFENHFRWHFSSIGHFGCLKFTFDGISGHFRSIRILIIF